MIPFFQVSDAHTYDTLRSWDGVRRSKILTSKLIEVTIVEMMFQR